MKKLLSLALLVAVGFVVGCQKSDEEKAKDAMKDAGTAATNAIPK
jgi:outer membrane lipoprotein-sorting protein